MTAHRLGQTIAGNLEGSDLMARQTTVDLLDDLGGGKAAETVGFGVDGVGYEIDLNGKNAKALRKALAEFVAAARPLKPVSPIITGSSRIRRPPGNASLATPAIVRAWALEQGIVVSAKDRVLEDIWEKSAARG